jgi:hypothetical protein
MIKSTQENLNNETKDILRIQGIRSRGYGIIPKITMQDRRMTIEAKAIYAYFCTYSGAGYTAFPSVKKICADLVISDERYRRHFRILVNYNYITVEQQKENGKFSRNIYTLIEHPIEIDMSKLPYPQNTCTENKPPLPYPQNTGSGNLGTNINRGKINTTTNLESTTSNKSQSVSQSVDNSPPDIPVKAKAKQTDRQTDKINIIEPSDQNLEGEVEKICTNAQTDLYTAKLFIEEIITKLYTGSIAPTTLRMGLTQTDVRTRLKLLANRAIDTALLKLKGCKTNKQLYFAKCLLTAIIENDVDDYMQEIQDE